MQRDIVSSYESSFLGPAEMVYFEAILDIQGHPLGIGSYRFSALFFSFRPSDRSFAIASETVP